MKSQLTIHRISHSLVNCQAPVPNPQSPIPNPQSPNPQSRGLGVTVKSYGPPTTTTTPQLLTMKEHSDNKVPLVRMSQDDPLNPPSTKNDQVDNKSYMFKKKNIIDHP